MQKGFGLRYSCLCTGTALAALVLGAAPAYAQEVPSEPEASTSPGVAEVPSDLSEAQEREIVVTGSRIRRAKTETPMPVTIINSQSIEDRGFISAAQALNNEPSLNKQLNQTIGDGSSSGDGIQAPSLFGLGTGRTLTLVNGRRMVTTASGLEDPEVDSNIIPLGLLQRVEVVQGGGAAVYGSDAIAGVVNYILRKDFTGVEADFQGGITSRGDNPEYSARLTAGTNFGGGRGNVAIDVGWSKVGLLPYGSRPRTAVDRITVDNPDGQEPDDGIPDSMYVYDGRFWNDSFGGVIYSRNSPSASALLGRQFAADGTIVSYNPGTMYDFFASGGDGLRYQDLVVGLRTGVERITANLIGHYDLTDNLTISTELLFARTDALEGLQRPGNSVLGDDDLGTGAIRFNRNNAFLSPEAIAALSAASPNFARGRSLYLSKAWRDLTNDTYRRIRTDTYRALLSLDGKFELGSRQFDWSLSGSYARVEGRERSWGIVLDRLENGLDARKNAAGQIVCAINANAATDDDDPSCAPINIFGINTVSDAARNYINAPSGSQYRNEQVDILATLSGSVVRLPAGDAKFAATYEHRAEKSRFMPFQGNLDGIFTGGATSTAARGRYNTDELAGELLVPLVGGDFKLPLIHALEVSGAYRYVDNSIAGTESVWNIGVRWQPIPDLTLRGSRGRNFRAPTLNALFAPTSTSVDVGGIDPCDHSYINGGPNPEQRRRSCLALFEANPTYGTGGEDGAPVGASAATRLAGFENEAINFPSALITSQGNPNLRNEVSNIWTYGLIFQPRFIPGLTFTADRIEIDLRDGFSPFTTEEFAATCYDDPNPPPGICDAFTRLATGTDSEQAGTWATGTTTTFNAGVIRYKGETYTLNYMLPLNRLFENSGARLEFNASATHTSLLEASVTGSVFTRYDNTAFNALTNSAQPKWTGRFDVNYTDGPLRLSYQAFYLSPSRAFSDATVENSVHPRIASNLTHSVSAQIDIEHYSFRFGVTNLTDRQPSFPTLGYGDIIGRAFYAGAKVRF